MAALSDYANLSMVAEELIAEYQTLQKAQHLSADSRGYLLQKKQSQINQLLEVRETFKSPYWDYWDVFEVIGATIEQAISQGNIGKLIMQLPIDPRQSHLMYLDLSQR